MATIALLDNNPRAREKMRQMLREDQSFQIIAEGQDGRFALPIKKAHNPDVFIISSLMPNVDGIEAAKELLDEDPAAKIIMLFQEDEEKDFNASLRIGVMGFVKMEKIEIWLKEAVRSLLAEKNYMDPFITSKVLQQYRHITQRNDDNSAGLHIFSKRELTVLQLLAKGKSNFDIADDLQISDKTVKNHISSILKKSRTKSRTRAVVKAIKYRWVNL
ncbi:response regulator transcription factor [Niallia sp. FSL R7-0271]|uniref:response regulator transcription factor n=1 Tax=Niallia sp. FSL R7-0271 TaxID=2921678 RepID=UPI0030FC56C8